MTISNVLRGEDKEQETEETSGYETESMIEPIFVNATTLNMSCIYAFIQI